jgi:hypothetical protein
VPYRTSAAPRSIEPDTGTETSHVRRARIAVPLGIAAAFVVASSMADVVARAAPEPVMPGRPRLVPVTAMVWPCGCVEPEWGGQMTVDGSPFARRPVRMRCHAQDEAE